jgi:predicted O-methyltransferase YrrM
MTTAAMPTAADYARVFEQARQLEYPEVDAFEQRMGHAIDRQRLEDAARVLACPVKANPPHWQHGRVLYAAARSYMEAIGPSGFVTPLDIGTAKGFSALILHWALDDSGRIGQVQSVDVIDPDARVSRNTAAEVDGLLTLRQTLRSWPESEAIVFVKQTGMEWLQSSTHRIHVAFIDGKHTGDVVRQEGKLLAKRQESGDLAIFDDCQIPGVSVAVASLHEWYRIEYLHAGPRQYGIARRR